MTKMTRLKREDLVKRSAQHKSPTTKMSRHLSDPLKRIAAFTSVKLKIWVSKLWFWENNFLNLFGFKMIGLRTLDLLLEKVNLQFLVITFSILICDDFKEHLINYDGCLRGYGTDWLFESKWLQKIWTVLKSCPKFSGRKRDWLAKWIGVWCSQV